MTLVISTDGIVAEAMQIQALSGTNFQFDTWIHMAVTFDISTQTAEFFVDGVSKGSATDAGATSIFDGTGEVRIGTDVNNAISARWDGKLDDVRVWSTIRTVAQISDNKDCVLTGSETNLEGYWRFTDDLLDQTANANNLTNNNAAVFSLDVPHTDPACAPLFTPRAIIY